MSEAKPQSAGQAKPGAAEDAEDIDARTGLKAKPPSGYWGGVMNHVKCCIGSGIFNLAYGMKKSGLGLGPPILLVLGLISLHCQHLLLAAGKEVEKNVGYRPDLAETGQGVFEFGPEKMKRLKKPMKIISNILLVATQTGVLCIYIVFFARSMYKVIYENRISSQVEEDKLVRMWIGISFVPITMFTLALGNMKMLGFLSLGANIFVLIGVVLTIYITASYVPSKPNYQWIGNVAELPAFMSITILTFSSIQVVLPIYIESKNPEKLGSIFGVLNVATIFEMVVTIFVGTLSYVKYGVDSKGSITLNFGQNWPARIAVVSVAIAVLLSYTLNMYVALEAVFPLIVKKWGPFRYPTILLLGFKFAWIVISFVLAVVLPFLGEIVSFVGAVGNTTICIIFPALFHVVITWKDSSLFVKIKDIFILFLGIFCLIAGVVVAIQNIVQAVQASYGIKKSNKN